MKKIIVVLALLAMVLFACSPAERDNVLLNGSTSVTRVVEALVEAFNEIYPEVTLVFNPTGSGAGIASAQKGTADIGFSSRALRDSETGVNAVVFAIDGLAMIVHHSNPITNLTVEQLAGIYEGVITNWSQVGGNDAPIAVIGREAGGGSRGAFEEILGVTDRTRHDQELTSGGAMITAVATNPYAIGYTSLSAVGATVRVIAVNGVEITEETLLDGSYPVTRPFIMMTQMGFALSPAAAAFMDFVMSDTATQIIANVGVLQAR